MAKTENQAVTLAPVKAPEGCRSEVPMVHAGAEESQRKVMTSSTVIPSEVEESLYKVITNFKKRDSSSLVLLRMTGDLRQNDSSFILQFSFYIRAVGNADCPYCT